MISLGTGEWAALAAAVLWTVSSLFWARINLSALNMNLSKCVIGTVLVGLHVVVITTFFDGQVSAIPGRSWALLGLSGLIGLVIGDTFFFRCLQILGPRRSLMLFTTSPVYSLAFAWTFLNESLIWLAVAGVFVTVAGVMIVVSDRKAEIESPGIIPGSRREGIIHGILGSICHSVGTIFSKLAMYDSGGTAICGFVEATWIRLFLAAIMLLMISSYQREIATLLQQLRKPLVIRQMIAGTTLGTWLGLVLSMLAIKESNVAVAQTLMSTCPLFAIPVCYFYLRQPVTGISIAGTMVAIAGVAMVCTK